MVSSDCASLNSSAGDKEVIESDKSTGDNLHEVRNVFNQEGDRFLLPPISRNKDRRNETGLTSLDVEGLGPFNSHDSKRDSKRDSRRDSKSSHRLSLVPTFIEVPTFNQGHSLSEEDQQEIHVKLDGVFDFSPANRDDDPIFNMSFTKSNYAEPVIEEEEK